MTRAKELLMSAQAQGILINLDKIPGSGTFFVSALAKNYIVLFRLFEILDQEYPSSPHYGEDLYHSIFLSTKPKIL